MGGGANGGQLNGLGSALKGGGGGGAFGGLLGTAGGAGGTGYAAPQQAKILQPTTSADAQSAQGGVEHGLQNSDALYAALQGQKGIQAQNNVLGQGNALYAALNQNNGTRAEGAAMGQQGNLAGQLGGANGVGIQTGAVGGLQNVLAQQQGTANQLQGIANGTGPNPAQAALNQTTGQNVANQAALMAGQRGASSNVGLMARQAAQQGAATQQQAVGQGATMQAQQELGAINALTGQQQAMGATNTNIAGIGSGLTAAQQAAISNQYGQGAGIVGQQQAQQGINAGIANNMVGNQMTANNQYVQQNLANAGQQYGVIQGVNNANVAAQGNVNTANAGLANQRQSDQGGLLGGVMQGAGQIGAKYIGNKLFDTAGTNAATDGKIVGAEEGGGAAAGAGGIGGEVAEGGTADQAAQIAEDAAAGAAARGGMVGPASSFVQHVHKSRAAPMAQGGMTRDFRDGGGVKASSPDEKAKKKGNSYSNDRIPAVLSEGEVVIPRSIMQSKDPARSAADFVSKVLAKRGRAS